MTLQRTEYSCRIIRETGQELTGMMWNPPFCMGLLREEGKSKPMGTSLFPPGQRDLNQPEFKNSAGTKWRK